MENKTKGHLLEENLSYKTVNAWEKVSEEEKEKAFQFCEGYKSFLNRAKTEREFAREVEDLARKNGFISVEEVMRDNTRLTPGMKLYRLVKKKAVLLAVVGKKPVTEGLNIIGAHIDAPRIDLKPNPLYEDTGLVMLKTHYYGGIKKYQWVTIPLALHGVFTKPGGEVINISIGEGDEDPRFTITDLLPHLAQDQMQKKMSEGITGEGLNLLFGHMPYNDEKVSEKVRLNILKLLNDRYGITEEDFISSELEIVPAFKAVDIGFDRSMVGAYGQDDRACAYGAVMALMEAEGVERTSVCVLTDKEEIGSVGNTGAQSTLFENFAAFLCRHITGSSDNSLFRCCLENSRMLSADVNPGVDPNFEGVQDKRNASFMGKGIVLQKYTGSRGKVGGSDANAEYLGYLRKLFNDNGIIWQSAELGKVDQGGGGTIAQYVANLGAEVLDVGVPVLSMHSPFEITSKIDLYMNYKANRVFYMSV